MESLSDFLEALTKEIPYQQARFDYDFLDRLSQFGPALEACRAAGLENLALAIAPRQSILDQVEIEVSYRTTQSSEQQVSLQVQPLNLGFSRRFAYSGFVQNRLQLSVRRIALEPRTFLKET
jgi:hypothetical protein